GFSRIIMTASPFSMRLLDRASREGKPSDMMLVAHAAAGMLFGRVPGLVVQGRPGTAKSTRTALLVSAYLFCLSVSPEQLDEPTRESKYLTAKLTAIRLPFAALFCTSKLFVTRSESRMS